MLAQRNFPLVYASIAMPLIAGCGRSTTPEPIKWMAMPDEKVHMTFQLQQSSGKEVKGEAKVLFFKNFAVVITYNPDARYGRNWDSFVVFDLEKMAWHENSTGDWVDVKVCQEWERDSIERDMSILPSVQDSATRDYIHAQIEPHFQVRKDQDGTLTVFNDFLKYEVRPEEKTTPYQRLRFDAYDRVSAYHKAMEERERPPIAQIALNDILAKEKIIPKRLVATIKTANGDVVASVDITREKFEIADAEYVERSLATIKKQP